MSAHLAMDASKGPASSNNSPSLTIDMGEFALEPERGGGDLGARDPAVADRAVRKPFVEVRQRILRAGEGLSERAPVEIGEGR